jgi:outer membrane autotransporter protein
VETTVKLHLRRQICTFALGLSLAVSATSPGEADTLTQLPGQNLAQQKMAISITNFCTPLNNLNSMIVHSGGTPPPGQVDLANICMALINNAATVNDPPPTFGLPTRATVNAALQQLNGGAELLVPTSQASVLQTTQTSRQTGVVEARLSRQRDGTVLASGEFPPTGQLAALSPLEPGGQILLAQNQAPDFAYAIGPLGVFATGLGQFGSRDLATSENGYSFNNAGFVVGADYRFDRQLVAGAAFGYTQSNTSFDTSRLSASGQSIHDNLLEGNLYATYSFTDALYMNAIAFVGGGSNNSQRHVVIPSSDPVANQQAPVDQIPTGSFGSQVQGVSVSGGYALPFGPLVVTPIVRFLYQHTGVDGFSENAFSVNLRYGSSRVDTVLSSLGADAQYTMSTSFGLLYPMARFHWAHQYSPGNTTVSPTFVNDATQLSTFILPGTPTSANYFDLGVGLGLQLSRNSSAFISYDSILGIGHTTYNSFTAGVRFTF